MKKPTGFFGTNIKFLRDRKRKTQEDVARELAIKRSKLNSYEFAVTLNPPVETLIIFSDYFKISIDTLLRVDLRELSELKLRELEAGNDAYAKGTKLRVLAATVNSSNEDNIELVSEKAKAGYLAGYADPEYVGGLPVFHLPDLPRTRKYRMFQVSGDSMLPVPDKSFVLGEFVEDWTEIKDEISCIIVSKNDGIVFKNVINQIKKNKTLLLHSSNPAYRDYEAPVSEVLEVWKFARLYTKEIPGSHSAGQLEEAVNEIRNNVRKLMLRNF